LVINRACNSPAALPIPYKEDREPIPDLYGEERAREVPAARAVAGDEDGGGEEGFVFWEDLVVEEEAV
jgi:hypothetical protein